MKAEHPLLNRVRRWLNDTRISTAEYEGRKERLRALNEQLGVTKVSIAVDRGHADQYEALIADPRAKP